MSRLVKTGAKNRKPSILVLCEGSATEPNYLGSLVRLWNLTSVRVPRDHDTDPLNLVTKAIAALKSDRGLKRAYVVFDRDEHANFNRAVGLANHHPLINKRLFIIRSFPSFEVWLLFHYERLRAPLSREQAVTRLKVCCPTYEKADAAVMDDIVCNLGIALENADFAYADAFATGEMNPSTEMQKLVRRLDGI